MLSNILISCIFWCSTAHGKCLQCLSHSNPSGVVFCSVGQMFSVAINSLLKLLSVEWMALRLWWTQFIPASPVVLTVQLLWNRVVWFPSICWPFHSSLMCKIASRFYIIISSGWNLSVFHRITSVHQCFVVIKRCTLLNLYLLFFSKVFVWQPALLSLCIHHHLEN